MAIVLSGTYTHHVINHTSQICGDLLFSRSTSSLRECALLCLLQMVCYMFEFSEVTNDCDVYTGIATFNTLPSQFPVPRVVYKGDTNCQRSGYTFVEDGNLCIKIIEKNMIWDNASRTCEQEDGRLLVLTSPAKINGALKYLTSNNRRYLYIGLTDVVMEGKWKWVDGTPFDIQMWSKVSFNNFDGDSPDMHSADCAVLGVPALFDEHCNDPYKFICERPQLV
ncbi:C-type lectin domain family 4 member M-like [Ylistrum balloti]|uniref:C-type lectin domain family 4 member M-like n=1 Tax=Ylistrum balloti TaxID=509963 RepID=UPI0029059A76|nr:C-type lectin domain family 4 member M-like [Ylistrum balloti]